MWVKKQIIPLLIISSLTTCGSDSETKNGPEGIDAGVSVIAGDIVNQTAIARTASNKAIVIDEKYLLDGSASTAAEGNTLSYSWQIMAASDGTAWLTA
ncbi:MAG: hypothetical protein HRU20_07265 [Pseudomonadales bacterium]|nr:hypothetical protein [Pseudomonadales bacterium]